MNVQPKAWKYLSRDRRAELISRLYQELGTVDRVASVIGRGVTTVDEYLAYSRVPFRLRKKFNTLSHRAFMRAIRTGGDLEQQLKQEKVKHDYYNDTIRWKRMGLENQLKIVREHIRNTKDEKELYRLEKRLRRMLEKLNGLDQK